MIICNALGLVSPILVPLICQTHLGSLGTGLMVLTTPLLRWKLPKDGLCLCQGSVTINTAITSPLEPLVKVGSVHVFLVLRILSILADVPVLDP